MQYRHSKHKGGCYFFTFNLAEKHKTYLTGTIDILRESVNRIQQNYLFVIDVIVVLPDCLNAIWTLRRDDDDYDKGGMLIKSGLSRQCLKGERINNSRLKKREHGIWRRRYWEHFIRDGNDFRRHIDYIHSNPGKHGYIAKPVEWPLTDTLPKSY